MEKKEEKKTCQNCSNVTSDVCDFKNVNIIFCSPCKDWSSTDDKYENKEEEK
jgi:hypothetical protein